MAVEPSAETVDQFAGLIARKHGYSMGEARGFIGAAVTAGRFANEHVIITYHKQSHGFVLEVEDLGPSEM